MEKKTNLPKQPSAKRTQYPIGSEQYTVYEEIGKGVSALVHRALCIPLNEIVAIKILDFERDKCDLVQIFIFFVMLASFLYRLLFSSVIYDVQFTVFEFSSFIDLWQLVFFQY